MTYILDFFRSDPIVAWLLTGAAVVLLIGMVARALNRFREWWIEREQERIERERLRLSAAMSVTEARPWTAKASKGFQRTRVTQREAP